MNANAEREVRATGLGHHASRTSSTQPLGLMRCGDVGRVLAVNGGVDDSDLERNLLEMGFVEGARIEVLHRGFLGGDPLAVRINRRMTIALRRCEANAVLIGPLHDSVVNTHPSMSLEYASS